MILSLPHNTYLPLGPVSMYKQWPLSCVLQACLVVLLGQVQLYYVPVSKGMYNKK